MFYRNRKPLPNQKAHMINAHVTSYESHIVYQAQSLPTPWLKSKIAFWSLKLWHVWMCVKTNMTLEIVRVIIFIFKRQHD